LCLHIILISEMVSSEWGYTTQRRTCYTSGHSTNVTANLEILNLHIREFAGSSFSLEIFLQSDGYRGLPQLSGKCGVETQSSQTPLPSMLHKINCSLSPWHFPGSLNQSYQSGYSNTFFNSSRQHPTRQYVAIYILYVVSIHTSVSIYVVRGDLLQMKCVKCIVSGKIHKKYKRMRTCI